MANDTIDNENKVSDALTAKVEKMQTGNGEVVHHRCRCLWRMKWLESSSHIQPICKQSRCTKFTSAVRISAECREMVIT